MVYAYELIVHFWFDYNLSASSLAWTEH